MDYFESFTECHVNHPQIYRSDGFLRGGEVTWQWDAAGDTIQRYIQGQ